MMERLIVTVFWVHLVTVPLSLINHRVSRRNGGIWKAVYMMNSEVHGHAGIAGLLLHHEGVVHRQSLRVVGDFADWAAKLHSISQANCGVLRNPFPDWVLRGRLQDLGLLGLRACM